MDAVEVLGPDIEEILGARAERIRHKAWPDPILVPGGKVSKGAASTVYCRDRTR
jgi:hypothetical protein